MASPSRASGNALDACFLLAFRIRAGGAHGRPSTRPCAHTQGGGPWHPQRRKAKGDCGRVHRRHAGEDCRWLWIARARCRPRGSLARGNARPPRPLPAHGSLLVTMRLTLAWAVRGGYFLCLVHRDDQHRPAAEAAGCRCPLQAGGGRRRPRPAACIPVAGRPGPAGSEPTPCRRPHRRGRAGPPARAPNDRHFTSTCCLDRLGQAHRSGGGLIRCAGRAEIRRRSSLSTPWAPSRAWKRSVASPARSPASIRRAPRVYNVRARAHA